MLTEWREGAFGAFRMGLRHGLFCVGCCWALMGLMWVAGMLNLLWLAALTLYMLAEKVLPGAERWSRWAGAVSVGVGTDALGSGRCRLRNGVEPRPGPKAVVLSPGSFSALDVLSSGMS